MKREFTEAMKPGVKYQGYGMLNNFREFMFVPAQKGANEGRMTIVQQGEGWSVHTTRENIVVHIKMPRKNTRIERITQFLSLQQQVLDVLKEYDLSIESKKSKSNK